MQVLITASEHPEQIIPLFAGLTDAARAQPGLSFIVLIDESSKACDIAGWAGLHPAVARCVYLDVSGLTHTRLTPRGFKARRRYKQWQKEHADIETLIDPFGTEKTQAQARYFAGKSVGVSARKKPSYKQMLAPTYNSQFPIPDELHPVQAARVLLAALFEYTLNDLTPDYGLPMATAPSKDGVDLVLDLSHAPWTDGQKAALFERLHTVELSVDDLQANPPATAAEYRARIENGRYLLCGVNAVARLGAALGKPGVCVCNPGEAKIEGAISSRTAAHKMINVDEPPMNQPAIITESIIQAMTKGKAKIVLPEEDEQAIAANASSEDQPIEAQRPVSDASDDIASDTVR